MDGSLSLLHIAKTYLIFQKNIFLIRCLLAWIDGWIIVVTTYCKNIFDFSKEYIFDSLLACLDRWMDRCRYYILQKHI